MGIFSNPCYVPVLQQAILERYQQQAVELLRQQSFFALLVERDRRELLNQQADSMACVNNEQLYVDESLYTVPAYAPAFQFMGSCGGNGMYNEYDPYYTWETRL